MEWSSGSVLWHWARNLAADISGAWLYKIQQTHKRTLASRAKNALTHTRLSSPSSKADRATLMPGAVVAADAANTRDSDDSYIDADGDITTTTSSCGAGNSSDCASFAHDR